jgi:cysteine desulfurase
VALWRVQPLAEIGRLCRQKKVFFHTDCAQMAGKVLQFVVRCPTVCTSHRGVECRCAQLPISVDDMNIDVLSLSGHKIYGPKGVGTTAVAGLWLACLTALHPFPARHGTCVRG